MAGKNINVIEGIKKWMYALMGKTPPSSAPKEVPEQFKDSQPNAQNEISEDSVLSDIKMFKSFASKGLSALKSAVSPVAKKSIEATSGKTKVTASLVDKKFFAKLIKLFLILFFVLILIFVGVRLFKMIGKDNGAKQNASITPSPIQYNPYKPSIYSQDPEVLRLEEEASILERELARTTVKEEGINPPNLDWDIRF